MWMKKRFRAQRNLANHGTSRKDVKTCGRKSKVQLIHNPTIYRIDRIENLTITDEHYKIPYKNRFEEGEFRKRVQFMFPGKLRRVRFKYKGYSMEAVEDRLPTARVIKTVKETVRDKEQDVFIVEAEVYGDGIDQWFRQQGDMVEVLE